MKTKQHHSFARFFLVLFAACFISWVSPHTVRADHIGGFVCNYPELIESLSDSKEMWIMPDEDFKWPTAKTTITISKNYTLSGIWTIPENITIKQTASDVKIFNSMINLYGTYSIQGDRSRLRGLSEKIVTVQNGGNLEIAGNASYWLSGDTIEVMSGGSITRESTENWFVVGGTLILHSGANVPDEIDVRGILSAPDKEGVKINNLLLSDPGQIIGSVTADVMFVKWSDATLNSGCNLIILRGVNAGSRMLTLDSGSVLKLGTESDNESVFSNINSMRIKAGAVFENRKANSFADRIILDEGAVLDVYTNMTFVDEITGSGTIQFQNNTCIIPKNIDIFAPTVIRKCMNGHSPIDQIIKETPATTTETGKRTYICRNCGSVTNTIIFPKLDPKPAIGSKFIVSGATYKVTSSSAVQFVSKNSASGTLTIPSTVKYKNVTYKVTSIASNACKQNSKITKLVIGSNVTSVGVGAFYKCSKLASVTIGSKVTSIGTNAFYGCVRLTNLNLGTKITAIGAKAFSKCTLLTKLTIPATVKSIGEQAFYGDSKLKSIVIKSSLLNTKNTGKKSFYGIYSKAVVQVPKARLSVYKSVLKAAGLSTKATVKNY